MKPKAALLAGILALSACHAEAVDSDRAPQDRAFPRADRPVAKVVSTQWAPEEVRDSNGEAQSVMDEAAVAPGMTVADIGAGEGYYTVRLAARVGEKGRVLAQDIDAGALGRLGGRIEREQLSNVSIKQGAPDDPRLPPKSFDRVFMIHMYHEIAEPYPFLWRLWPALKAGGSVIVVDADRPTDKHGTPSTLLFCEFETAGFRLVAFRRKPDVSGYYAQFVPAGSGPPEPSQMRSCHVGGNADGGKVGGL
ncbi:ubiquinone biosynthesis methyltransferase UbiE [Novosphingobium fuchskuhlense]|uniref:Ubiquinone biosynthesis methyltransferase UbiE n=1 Tax=Novosphingobium fuchskuhlense TaxID=1117702 RepID=A0A124JV14_9SPHN|nr:class I SAM-dependent methyltransferase [Novosphingobium fuchskuhlense]KUR71765.1 ubiquinone biosynthesis methyltransferase UbiE [Novosphingobium fuchskuhlense]